MKLTKRQLRRIIQEEMSGKKTRSLSSILFEEPEKADFQAIAQKEDAKPVTLVVLYGPPAAGKGAAKGAVGDFAGIDADKNYEDWLESMSDEDASAFFAEEDEAMVSAMTEQVKLKHFIWKVSLFDCSIKLTQYNEICLSLSIV